jgi:uncharacterized protein YndB with AHSA1/START domain
MSTPTFEIDPVATTGMRIRRPVAEVFEAFVDPEITANFWFSHGSGRLEAGGRVQWDWEMYGLSVPVTVQALQPNALVVIEWQGPTGGPKKVTWNFADQGDATTFVTIRESGFTGDRDQLVAQVMDSTRGFTLLLAGAKAYLEHQVQLHLVTDSHSVKKDN